MSGSWSSAFVATALLFPTLVAFRDCIADVCLVSGVSMQPSLNPFPDKQTLDKYFFSRYFRDIVLLERVSVRSGRFNKGSVVMLKSVEDPNRLLLKRIVALDGDWISDRDEKYVHIPRGHCWVEGDNCEHSIDSNEFGPVPLGMVFGRVTHVIWPPWRVGKVETLSEVQIAKARKKYAESNKPEEDERFIEIESSKTESVESIMSNLDLTEAEKKLIRETMKSINDESE